jgi:chromosome segregation ATPase
MRLASQIGILDEKIQGEAAALGGGDARRSEASGIEATLASLRAERETIAAEEPTIAAEIEDVEPRLAALKAKRADAEQACAELEAREREDQIRADEIRAAVVARKAVEERAVADLGRAQDRAFKALGERVYLERPAALVEAATPVERSDLRIAELQRRAIELTELVGAVNRRAFLRGIAWLALATLVVAGALVAFLALT